LLSQFVELRLVAQQGGQPLTLNGLGPPSTKAARLRQADHQVPQRCGIEQARIKDDREVRHSVPQAKRLRLRGQLVRRRGPFPIDAVAVVHQIREADSPMSPDFVKWDLARL
jgi:hypothetical protein